MSQRKKVFLCTDTFTYSRDYYVVVGPECDSSDAEEAAKNELCPEYFNEEPGAYNGLCDTTCEDSEEYALLLLKKSSLLGKRRRFVHLLPVAPVKLDPDYYQGYPIVGDKVKLQLQRYPKNEWELIPEKGVKA